MKILIVSDTHGKDNMLLEAVRLEKPISKIIHLGDIGKLEEYIEELTDCVCFAVKGNNDWYSKLPDENIVMIGKYRAFITHGHHYDVSFTSKDLVRHGRMLDCEIVMYGHTHYPEITREGNIIIINPGSLTFPRQPGHKPSYIVAEVDDAGEVNFELKYL